MARIFKILVSGGLLFVAALFAISWPISMFLWMFVIGDTHEHIWDVLPAIFVTVSAIITFWFVVRDVNDYTTARSRAIRLIFSIVICSLVAVSSIASEVQRFKGWTSEDAALSVAASLYPDVNESLVLIVESHENIPSWGRGPNITYLIQSGETPLCRVSVSRKYWSYWTCGMYETLKERKPNIHLQETLEDSRS